MTSSPPSCRLVLVLGLAGTAAAQLPFPLPGQPQPDLSKRPQCTKDYVKSVEQQIAMLEKLRSAGPEAVGQVCSLIELGSDWLGGELPDSTRKQLKDMLGFDIDLRFIKTQCRVGQGNLDRELMTRLGFLQVRAGALQRYDLARPIPGCDRPSTRYRAEAPRPRTSCRGYPCSLAAARQREDIMRKRMTAPLVALAVAAW